jgi:hypothetical protein
VGVRDVDQLGCGLEELGDGARVVTLDGSVKRGASIRITKADVSSILEKQYHGFVMPFYLKKNNILVD